MTAVDHVTSAQCAVISQTIPILFVLFIAERAIDHTPIPHPFDWCLVCGTAFLFFAEIIAFIGIDGGLTGPPALVVMYGLTLVLVVLLLTLAERLVRKPSAYK